MIMPILLLMTLDLYYLEEAVGREWVWVWVWVGREQGVNES